MKDLLRRESVVDIQADGDPYWFNNPQYRLTSDEPLEVGQSPTSGLSCLPLPARSRGSLCYLLLVSVQPFEMPVTSFVSRAHCIV